MACAAELSRVDGMLRANRSRCFRRAILLVAIGATICLQAHAGDRASAQATQPTLEATARCLDRAMHETFLVPPNAAGSASRRPRPMVR